MSQVPTLPPQTLLALLLGTVLWLGIALVALTCFGAWNQMRKDRFHRARIACHQRWEREVAAYAFQGVREGSLFQPLKAWEKDLLIPFLLRVIRTLGGSEGKAVRSLYGELNLAEGIEQRLISGRPRVRALAALEVGAFEVGAARPRLLALLADRVPHVAHTAARSLAASRDLAHAPAVLDWALGQESFQRERLLWVLEGLGPELMDWLAPRLDGPGGTARLKVLYALLVASTRQGDPARLEAFLDETDTEVVTAAIKGLGALGRTEHFGLVEAHVRHPQWVVRAQVAKALGVLGGVGAVPRLLELIQDPVFEVRRNAAFSLSEAGQGGLMALQWLVEDADSDAFARDLARERLQWTAHRGRA